MRCVSILVVTGTDTGVGKTVVAAAVASLARERGASAGRPSPVRPAPAWGPHWAADSTPRRSGGASGSRRRRRPARGRKSGAP
ncbi:AAA family ATPase [Streptosporangium canum]|uniref:AAA family ATPase n=1 Tax=Streptosporangium canum TaxID=324952 RepID=UPI003693B24A